MAGRDRAAAPRIPGSGAGLLRRRVPVIMQLNAVECGPACLAMILGYHGRKTPVSECRERCDAGRDGVSALTLAQAARSFGLRVKAYRAEPHDLGNLPLPAIVHWEFNHYVVVERWSPEAVDIVDPASGRRRLRAAELEAGLTGVVLTLSPGAALEPESARAGASWIRYLRAYALAAPGILAQTLAASLVLQLLGLAVPAVTKLLVDHVLPQRDPSLSSVFAIGAAAAVLAQVVIGYLRACLLLKLQARVDGKMMPAFFEHLLSLPLRFFEQRSSGDLLMRLSSNTILRDTLTGQALSLALDGALVLGYLAILVARAPVFGLMVGALGLFQVALLIGSSRRMAELAQRDVAAQSESQSYLVEALGGIAALKTSGAEERAHDHWMDLFSRHIHASLERNRHGAAIEAVMTSVRFGAPLAMLWVGSREVLSGAMSLGTLLALNALGIAFLMPLSSLVQNGQRLPQIRAHLARLADVMQAEPEQPPGAGRRPLAPAQRIELQNVGFRHDSGSPWILRGVSLTIEPGQTVALVGRTGSGKTTLLKLLLGLYPLSEGRILHDGIPIESLDYRTLRSQVGVVLQDPFLFTGSIRDNIAFGDRSMPLRDIEEGARKAAIHDDIARMPMGYETRLAEGGAGLSGGQRQRVAIARALAHRPRVLLLDEATSHLDAATERAVEENVRALACTRVVIAHRLSTVRLADRIALLERGTIVEQGTHDELLAEEGHYAALVRGQA